MLKNKAAIVNVLKKQVLRKHSTTEQITAQKWDLFCGLCLERKPIVTRPLSKLELEFKEMLKVLEDENSKKSDHEIRHEGDLRRSKEFKKGKVSTEDLDKAVGQTALEFEDTCMKEYKVFQPASRITEADQKNDSKSTERKLDKHLLYIISENIGPDSLWILPSDKVQQGETLRQAAERILLEKCGTNIRAKFYGNAPCGFYKYKYPKSIRERNASSVGAKIFFMKAQHLKGSIQESKISDYNWAIREELPELFLQPYYKAVSSFLIDDESIHSN